MRRLIARVRAHQRLKGIAGLWYHPEYVLGLLANNARVTNIEPRRGELIVGKLMQEGLIHREQVRTPTPATLDQLVGFHPLAYVEQTLSPEILGRIFGLDSDLISDPDLILRWVRHQVGGTIAAAWAAVNRPGFVGFNLGGGFHHAEPEQGSGFCVYNDVGVAIANLRARGYQERIAIVDLDYHQGNGNSIAFAEDPSVLVYSLHGAVWSHLGNGDHETHLTGTVNDRHYLAALNTTLQYALSRFRPKLVFYIAGNDVLANDHLGDFWLSLHGVLQRDLHVLDVAGQLGASTVVTMGGGYSPGAWRASYHLARFILTGIRKIEPAQRREAPVRTRFTRIARTLDQKDLTAQEDDFELTEADVFGDLRGGAPSTKFLDFYSEHGIEFAFERYGLLEAIRKRGFTRLHCAAELADRTHQVVRVLGRHPSQQQELLLVELVVRRLWIKSGVPEQERMEVLFVEWLLLQDPTRSFTLQRPALPGQEHPGLGIALQMQELLVQACRRLSLHGVFERPAHYHNLLGGASDAHFLDPEQEGRAQAILTVLAGVPPWIASRTVHSDGLKFGDGTIMSWQPEMHGIAVSSALKEYFESQPYRSAAQRAMASYLDRGLAADLSD